MSTYPYGIQRWFLQMSLLQADTLCILNLKRVVMYLSISGGPIFSYTQAIPRKLHW